MRARPDHQPRGSALILVLWCLLLLGMAVFGVVELVELSVAHTAWSERTLAARMAAASGLAIGLNPQILKDDPLLDQKLGDGTQFKVALKSEGARLNLNYVLLSEHRDILVNLFTQWGLKVAEADHVADCLYDWITPGDLRSLNGAKASDYAQAGLSQRPSGLPFQSLEEASHVLGMDLLEKARPNWRDSFTLWSSGPLNLAEAPADLIAAVFGIEQGRVETFTKNRDGRDGIPGTSDDVKVTDIKTVQAALGLTDRQVKDLGSQISFDDPNRRVESVGQAQGTQVILLAVTRLHTSPVQYLLWLEP